MGKQRKLGNWVALKHQFTLTYNDGTQREYLKRWIILRTPFGSILLHKMSAPDARLELHDHPWSFLSIVLRGGYTERRLNTRTYRVDENHHIKRFNKVSPYDFHAITKLDRNPTWTLIFTGRLKRTWGFLTPSMFPHVDGHFIWTQHEEFDAGMDAIATRA